MIIKGLQKLTLLDFPGKTACTVFTGGCNFRCPFCHNAALVTELDKEFIPENEFFDFLSSRKDKLDGVAITGGEPLLNKDIGEFIAKIKALGFAVKLDTNGSFPERLEELLSKNLLDYVAIDIKNSPEKYALTVGIASVDVESVQKSVRLLIDGSIDYEFRTTVPSELFEEKDFEAIASFISGAKRYYIQQFKDSGNLIEEGLFTAEKKETLERYAEIVKKTVEHVEIRGV